MEEPADNWWESKGHQKKKLTVWSTKVNKSEYHGIIS